MHRGTLLKAKSVDKGNKIVPSGVRPCTEQKDDLSGTETQQQMLNSGHLLLEKMMPWDTATVPLTLGGNDVPASGVFDCEVDAADGRETKGAAAVLVESLFSNEPTSESADVSHSSPYMWRFSQQAEVPSIFATTQIPVMTVTGGGGGGGGSDGQQQTSQQNLYFFNPIIISTEEPFVNLPSFGEESLVGVEKSLLSDVAVDPTEEQEPAATSSRSKSSSKQSLDTTWERRFKCSECGATYNSRKNLVLHEASHKSSPFICPDCGRKFVRLASFKSHLSIHEEEDSLTCPKCEADFPNESELLRHVKAHAAEEDETATGGNEKSSALLHRCRKCDRDFFSKASLSIHIKEHGKIKRLVQAKQKRKKRPTVARSFRNVCKYCSKSFRKPSQCLRHERIHTGEKPFKCEQCSKSFNQKNSLEVHERKHTGDRPYECEICHMSFAQTGNLRTHIVRVHSASLDTDNLFRCEDCPCAFKKIGSLNAHIGKYHSAAAVKVDDMKVDDDDAVVQDNGSVDKSDSQQRVRYLVVMSKEDHSDSKARKHVVKLQLGKGGKCYACHECKKEFKKPSDLCRHLAVHSAAKSFFCKKCPRSFSSKSVLSFHERIHKQGSSQLSRLPSALAKSAKSDQQRPTASKGTATTTTTTSLLSRSNDAGEKKYQCEICDRLFSTKGSCRRHLLSHSTASEQRRPQIEVAVDSHSRSQAENSSVLNLDNEDKFITLSSSSSSHPMPIVASISEDGVISLNPSELGLDMAGFSLGTEEFLSSARPPSVAAAFTPAVADLTSLVESSDQLDSKTYSVPIVPEDAMNVGLERPPPFSDAVGIWNDQHQLASISERIMLATLAEKDEVKEMTDDDNDDAQPAHGHRCGQCRKSFKKPSDLLRHLRTHTGEKPFACELCSKRFSLKSTLASHMRTHSINSTKTVLCHICSSYFACKSSLKIHMRLHTGAKPYKCPHCDERFRTSSLRKTHILSAHSSTTRNRISIPAASLALALNSVSEIGVPLLGSTVKLQLDPGGGSGLDSPVMHLLVDQTLLDQLQKGCDITVCVDPPSATSASDLPSASTALDGHDERIPDLRAEESVATRTDLSGPKTEKEESALDDSKTCSFCKRTFGKPSQLKRHLRIHTGERPFVCDKCDRGFNQKNALRIHMKKHTGERPFICPFCSYAFSQKCNLKTHIQRAHAVQAQQLVERTLVR